LYWLPLSEEGNGENNSAHSSPKRIFTQPGSISEVGQGKRYVCFPPDSDRTAEITGGPVRADIVAKVFLRGGTQILRPIGAAIE
jgi:hypothetical protein